jgi:hypothetical protein
VGKRVNEAAEKLEAIAYIVEKLKGVKGNEEKTLHTITMLLKAVYQVRIESIVANL